LSVVPCGSAGLSIASSRGFTGWVFDQSICCTASSIAVTQLLNRRDGLPFDEADERRYADFAGSLGLLLESLVAMGGGPTA
jgi:hypothetical protein